MSNDTWIKIKHKQYPKEPLNPDNKETIGCGAVFTIKVDDLYKRLGVPGTTMTCPSCGADITKELREYAHEVLRWFEKQKQDFDFSLPYKRAELQTKALQLVERLLKALSD